MPLDDLFDEIVHLGERVAHPVLEEMKEIAHSVEDLIEKYAASKLCDDHCPYQAVGVFSNGPHPEYDAYLGL